MFTKRLLQAFTLAAVLFSSASFAQTPQLDLLVDGNLIIGIVNTASGDAASDATVTVENTTQANDITTLMTDTAGVFTLSGAFETDYRLSVAVNGQSVSGTVRTGEAPPEPFQWPPIYITLALLGLLSLIPAHFLRREEFQS